MAVAGFKDALKQAVRQIAFRTSLDSLKKQGVEQVSVLGIDRIIALIEEAVHRSLKSRLVGIEREAVADATKSEFLRLLRTNQDLQRQKSELEKLKERAEDEVDQLRRELTQQKQVLEEKIQQQNQVPEIGRYEGENTVIAQKVREMIQAMARGGRLDPTLLQERVYELVMDSVSSERQSADEARRALRDREVDNLQRRIQKLTQSLETTEHRLRQVAAMKHIDDGISSIYRDVQGLSPEDTGFGKKKELMAAIFQANMRLQKKAD